MDGVATNKNLTPIKFTEISSPRANDIVPRLEIILKTIYANHSKWEAAHKRGLSLCNSIEAIKSRCLESSEISTTKYPEELKPFCDKLAFILTIFEDISKSCSEFSLQLRAISKLNKSPDEILFRTWRLENFLDFIKIIKEKYEQELEVKRFITKQIAHSSSRFELIMHSSCWQYPEFVNKDFQLTFKFFSLEINSLIKT